MVDIFFIYSYYISEKPPEVSWVLFKKPNRNKKSQPFLRSTVGTSKIFRSCSALKTRTGLLW